jgi:F plasmid transfer operon protein
MEKEFYMTRIIATLLMVVSINGFCAKELSFWKTHTFVMIYSSQCPHCHRQASVLAPIFESFDIPHMLFSIDGKALPAFENFQKAPVALLQAAYPDGRAVYPATFIIENNTLRLYPLAKGFLNEQELKERVGGLAQKIVQFEGDSYEA